MPKKNDPDKDIEFYKLWYEFLRRSKPFEEFCALTGDERRGSLGNSLEAMHRGAQLRGMFANFGNPFKQTFVVWYKEQKERGEYGKYVCDHRAVREIDFYYYTAQANRSLASKGIEKPTRKDIGHELNDLCSGMKRLFLDIDLKADETQVLRLVKKLFKERRKGETFSKYDAVASKEKGVPIHVTQKTGLHSHSTLPTGRRLNNELEKYLYAYDRDREGADHIDITDEVLKKFPSRQIKNKADLSKHYGQGLTECGRWISSAKKIIANLEWSQEFPGVYVER